MSWKHSIPENELFKISKIGPLLGDTLCNVMYEKKIFLKFLCFYQGRIIQGAKKAIAKGQLKIGGTTLADCKMDSLVAFIIF